MNIRTSFYFFMGMAFSFSAVICHPPSVHQPLPLPRWRDFTFILTLLYGENKDIRTSDQCEKGTEMKFRLLLVYEVMGNIAAKNLRDSATGYLQLPGTIPEEIIHSEVVKDISEIKEAYKKNGLTEPLCKLIQEKCFSDKNFENESDDSILEVPNIEEMAPVDCEIDGKVEFTYSVLLEHLVQRPPHLTAFVYKVTKLTDSVELTFLACLPLMDFQPPEVRNSPSSQG